MCQGDEQDFDRRSRALLLRYSRGYGAKQQRRNQVPPSGIKQNVTVISRRALSRGGVTKPMGVAAGRNGRFILKGALMEKG